MSKYNYKPTPSIRAIIKTKRGLRTILTDYHIKNNPNCEVMYSYSTGRVVWDKHWDNKGGKHE